MKSVPKWENTIMFLQNIVLEPSIGISIYFLVAVEHDRRFSGVIVSSGLSHPCPRVCMYVHRVKKTAAYYCSYLFWFIRNFSFAILFYFIVVWHILLNISYILQSNQNTKYVSEYVCLENMITSILIWLWPLRVGLYFIHQNF